MFPLEGNDLRGKKNKLERFRKNEIGQKDFKKLSHF